MRLCVVVYAFPTFATYTPGCGAGCAAEEAAASPADPGVWGCDADDEEGGTAAVTAAEATVVEDCLSSMLFSAFSESISFSSASIFWICALYCSVKNTHARTHYIHIFHWYTKNVRIRVVRAKLTVHRCQSLIHTVNMTGDLKGIILQYRVQFSNDSNLLAVESALRGCPSGRLGRRRLLDVVLGDRLPRS